MINTILFDLDGTLINTPEMIMESFKRTVHKYTGETNLSEEVITNVLGQTLDRAFVNFAENENELLKMIASYRKFTESVEFELKTYENFENVIKYLRSKNYKVGIVTSKSGAVVEENLASLGIKDMFDCIVTYEDTDKHKPNADPILKACEILGVKPENTIYIGDHENDIKAGNNANIKTGLMGYSFRKEQALKENPTYIFETLTEIKKIF